MTAELNAAFTFTDIQALAGLRREAAGDTPEARRAVAQQFESLFIGLLLSQMRNASVIDGGLFDRERLRFHEDLHDRQLSLELARSGGIGLADSILRQLGDEPPPRAATAETFHTWMGRTSAPAHSGRARDVRAEPSADPFQNGSREEFVAALWPHARRAAAELGIAPEVLVAQAALETGWGRHMIRDDRDRPSFNLFGIKASGSWSGARVTVPTLEFVAGVPERRREPFRVYGSVEQSFDDYVALVRGLPRYRQAVGAGSAEAYARALEAGGYSTDPRYADKIIALVEQGLPGRDAQEMGAADDSSIAGPPGGQESRFNPPLPEERMSGGRSGFSRDPWTTPNEASRPKPRPQAAETLAGGET